MRLLSKENVFAENKLFATVDSTVRKVVIHDIPFLLTDTVGFIRKLPTTLIECFKSTLDEVREADMLIHVIDVSSESFEDQRSVVKQTLVDIGAADKPTLEVYNKIDLLEAEEREVVEASYLSVEHTAFVSVANQTNMEELKNDLFGRVAEQHFSIFPNYKSHYYDYYKEFLAPNKLKKEEND
jgi:GTP-binding protein HflX